jgi:hypothetical protein
LPVVRPSDDEEEVEGKRPPYCISGRQYMYMERMKMIVGRDKEQDWLDEMASDDGDSDDDNRLDEEQEEALESHVLQFMLSLLDHVLGDSEYTAVVTTSRMLVLY